MSMTSGSAPLVIDWIVDRISGDAETGWSSTLASNRYRVILPAQGMARQGHRIRFTAAGAWTVAPTSSDVVIIGKVLPGKNNKADFPHLARRVLDGIAAAQAQGKTVIADFNDDHFDRDDVGPYWRSLASAVSLCVAGSGKMAERLGQLTTRPIRVIEDPVASPRGAARVFRQPGKLAGWGSALLRSKGAVSRLKLVWYGSEGNWPAMAAWLQAIGPFAKEQRFLVWVVCSVHPKIQDAIERFNTQFGPDALVELVSWDEATQWSVVADSDAVLIPSDPNDPKKAVKTANRLVDALHAGRHVIASPLPSYLPFESVATLTGDPLAALRDYVARPEEALRKTQEGQSLVLQRHGEQAIVSSWMDALGVAGVAGVAADAPGLAASPPGAGETGRLEWGERPGVKLNLGCGDKILAGYVNVDVAASRGGKSPDVLCDLRDLDVFPSNHADEILSVHVIEHFWRWEVEDVLREWLRVLKPGGELVLECPNLQAACEAFLADPEGRSVEGGEGRTTMWVFYGDPKWKDPLMVHRWGYTPASLGRVMASVGFVDVRQAPAQYKMREPRDMRMVGRKPDGASAVAGSSQQEGVAAPDGAALPGAPEASGHADEVAVLREAKACLAARNVAAASALLTPLAKSTQRVAVLTYLAKVRLIQGNQEDALVLLKRAEVLDPDDPLVWDAMAELMRLSGRPRESVTYRRKQARSPELKSQLRVHIALLDAMAHAADEGVSLVDSDVQDAVRQARDALAGQPESSQQECIEVMYRLEGFQEVAREAHAQISPPSEHEHDVPAEWMSMSRWAEFSGITVHGLPKEVRNQPGAFVGELSDACVSADFQWIPLLDEQSVALLGFQNVRMRTRRENAPSAILFHSRSQVDLRLPERLETVEEPAVLIGGLPQYYHHTVEYASRLALLEAMGLGAGLRLVVNDDLAPFQLEHYALLGYAPDRLIRVKSGQPMLFRRLLAPTLLVHGGTWMDPMIAPWYRQRLVTNHGAGLVPSRRLYLSRHSAQRRKVTNEDELIHLLAGLGYEVVYPEALSVRAQIDLFASASHIVAPTGAALTNMVYAPPGARVTVLYSSYFYRGGGGGLYFDALAKACGHHMSVVLGRIEDLGENLRLIDADYRVEPKDLTAALLD
jgi:SAM-dependent methyltransferase